MLELLGVVATFVDRRKEFTMEPSGNLDQDCNVILAMYGLVFQAFAEKVACCINIINVFDVTFVQFQHEWEKGLQTLDDALWAMPKVITQHLFKYKLIFKSRMGKSVESDMTKFQVKFSSCTCNCLMVLVIVLTMEPYGEQGEVGVGCRRWRRGEISIRPSMRYIICNKDTCTILRACS